MDGRGSDVEYCDRSKRRVWAYEAGSLTVYLSYYYYGVHSAGNSDSPGPIIEE